MLMQLLFMLKKKIILLFEKRTDGNAVSPK